jgi:molecular chaperone DnaK (HSP70)
MAANSTEPRLGIDFGTTFSSMSWFNAKADKAEILLNQEGESKTPSAVYYRTDGVSVVTDRKRGDTWLKSNGECQVLCVP